MVKVKFYRVYVLCLIVTLINKRNGLGMQICLSSKYLGFFSTFWAKTAIKTIFRKSHESFK